MKIFLLSLILSTSLLANGVWAQSLKLEYEGRDGIWFPREMAARILADVKTSELLRIEVGELKLQLDTRLERIEALKEAVHHSEVAIQKSTEALTLAYTERDEARAQLGKWYRHPALWVVVGIVGTILLEVGAVKILQAASD